MSLSKFRVDIIMFCEGLASAVKPIASS